MGLTSKFYHQLLPAADYGATGVSPVDYRFFFFAFCGFRSSTNAN
jgi:hypothetical protein